MKTSWTMIALFLLMAVIAGLAMRWNSVDGTGDSHFFQPTYWRTPASTTSTPQPIEATGWWNELPTPKPVGKSTTAESFLTAPKP